jgi:beta-glucuronidase
MLYPVQNAFRNILDLSGLWKFKIDPQNLGEKEKWFNGFNSNMDIALPGSWNEQLEEAGLLHYVGSAWYYRKIILPTEYNRKRILIRIGSADYNSKIWINGKFVGENKLGFLPFEFDITRFCKLGEQCDIVILVNNELTSSTIPQGIRSSQYLDENRLREETNPPARFDFSPFGGIHRPVQIITTPLEYIKLIKIDTKITGLRKGEIQAEIEIFGSASSEIIIFIDNHY